MSLWLWNLAEALLMVGLAPLATAVVKRFNHVANFYITDIYGTGGFAFY